MITTAIVLWLKTGIIAWALTIVVSIVYVCIESKCNLEFINLFAGDKKIGTYREKAPKIRVIARTLIWPWGIIEVFGMVVDDVEKVKRYYQNRWRRK